jgi:hypothetical protein
MFTTGPGCLETIYELDIIKKIDAGESIDDNFTTLVAVLSILVLI